MGYELAGQFADGGFDLIVAAEDDGIAAAARDFERYGGQAIPVQVDLSSYEGIESLYLAIQSTASPVAVLAINARTCASGDFVTDSQLAYELRLVSTNVTSVVHLTKRVLAGMMAHDSGVVLFASAPLAPTPSPWRATYAASTAFLRAFAEQLESELADTSVTVAALTQAPGDAIGFGDMLADYVPLASSPGGTIPV